MAAQTRHGVDRPYIDVDLRQWLPQWAAGSVAGPPGVEEPDGASSIEQLASAIRRDPRPRKAPLTPAQWTIAFDAFALGAAACGMMDYPAALAHKVVWRLLCIASYSNCCSPFLFRSIVKKSRLPPTWSKKPHGSVS